ncbi:hypothetical protein PG996_014583 [Apiospora saccharicola]|uniref:Myb-like domain-containing protein n=1 Tax=Apiospora saccharicola TaxID=335842 RepID=A0ABR1TLD7_9PEZI
MTPEQEKSIIFGVLMNTNPELAGGNWAEIAPKVGLGTEIVRKRFAAMRKEFLENQANNGAGSAPAAAAASTPKKRARKSKITKPVDPEEDDDEVDGTPAKKQRRGRPSKKAETTAPKVEAGSENGADDEVSLKIWLRPHTSPWTPN